MKPNENRRISARTPLYDHAGAVLGHYPRERVLEIMQQPGVLVIGSRKRIFALHFLGPDPALLMLSGSKHRRPAGTPHRNENYYNPPGVWHLDRIPVSWSPLFRPNVEKAA